MFEDRRHGAARLQLGHSAGAFGGLGEGLRERWPGRRDLRAARTSLRGRAECGMKEVHRRSQADLTTLKNISMAPRDLEIL